MGHQSHDSPRVPVAGCQSMPPPSASAIMFYDTFLSAILPKGTWYTELALGCMRPDPDVIVMSAKGWGQNVAAKLQPGHVQRLPSNASTLSMERSAHLKGRMLQPSLSNPKSLLSYSLSPCSAECGERQLRQLIIPGLQDVSAFS